MIRMLSTILFMFSIVISVAQNIYKEKVIREAGKSLGVFSTFGVKSVVSGAGPSGSGLISAIEVTDVINDGFIVRNGYTFTKYNEEFEKEWEKEIDKVYGLQAMPIAFTIGKKNLGTYFVQLRRNPSRSEIHITRFDNKGNFTQTIFKVEDKYKDVVHGYINEDGLNLLITSITKKIVYSLITFSGSNLAPKVKTIPLESDDYELEHSNNFNDPQYYYWRLLKELDDKLILQKTYFKDIAKSKKKESVLMTVELNKKGIISNSKNYAFYSKDDSRFSSAQLEYDEKLEQIYVFGYMTINASSRFFDGIYLAKYDYTSAKQVFTKNLEFKTLNDLANANEVKEKVAIIYSNTYLLDFSFNGSYNFDEKNHLLTLFLFNDAKGLLKQRLNLNFVTFNVDGEVNKIDGISYKNHIQVYPDFVLVPESIINIYDKKEPRIPTSLDFIQSFSGKEDTNLFFWKIFPRKDFNYDVAISVRESNGEIKAFKLGTK